MSFFENIPEREKDPILSIPILFERDTRAHKINLGIGIYKTAEGLPYTLSSIKKAEQHLLHKQTDKEYLPILGDAEFIELTERLIFGDLLFESLSKSCVAAQTVGGTSALRIGGEVLSRLICKEIFIPQPSWANHKQTFEYAGLSVGSYPYYSRDHQSLNFKGMCEALLNMPQKAALLLHASCHNPTGIDPTLEQWKELSCIIKRKQLIPFFDMAYLGLGEGINEDAAAIRLFASEGHEMMIATSFSKNFTLYGERVGLLTLVLSSDQYVPSVESQVKSLIRGNYSNPPLHGAKIVSTILKSIEWKIEWEEELSKIRSRIQEMRQSLALHLNMLQKEIDFSFLLSQRGLFSFIGLQPSQVSYLREEGGIYMPGDGRINIAGLNTTNIPYVAESIVASLNHEKSIKRRPLD